MYSKSGQDLSRYFSELVAAALALREKASSWTVKSWFQTAVNFHSIIFCNAFTRPPEIGRADAGSARVRPAEERQKAPGCVVSGHGAPNLRLCRPLLSGREPLSSFSVQPEAKGCQTVA
jgi:hypothetical protein